MLVRINNNFKQEDFFNNLSFQQTSIFAKIKKDEGKDVLIFIFENNKKIKASMQLIKYTIPVIGSIWVSPRGYLGELDGIEQKKFFNFIKNECIKKCKKSICIRMGRNAKNIFLLPAEKSNSHFKQPKEELVIDLTKNVRSKFSKNLKKELNKLEREDNFSFEFLHNNFSKYAESMYDFNKIMSKSKKIGFFDLQYFKSVFSSVEGKNGILAIARDGDSIISMNLTVFYNDKAYNFLFSTKESYKDKKISPYMQYKVISYLKDNSFKRYNLGGVSQEKRSPLYKLFLFKKKFGGDVIDYGREYDLVLNPILYFLFRIARLKISNFLINMIRL